MADAFATVDELYKAYPSLPEDSGGRAEFMLGMVSAAIRAVCDYESVDEDVLKLVTIQATARNIQASKEAPIGASQTSWTASPFGGSTTWSGSTSGDIYLTSFEKSLLGADEGTAFYINQTVDEESS
jgi:hypothetical protein